MRLNSNLRIHRRGSGPSLILLHCLGVDHHLWDFATSLENDFTVVRYDLPGHGETAVPQTPYSIEDLADQLSDIMSAHDIKRASVAGISLGGLVAQDFAARYAGKVDRLVLIDTTPQYDDVMSSKWAERAAIARKTGVAAMVDTLLAVWFSTAAIERNTAGVQYTRTTLCKADGEGYALACEALAAADLRQQAKLIKARTAVICGDDDIQSFIDAAHWLAEHIDGARLSWIPGGRHAAILEDPEEAVRLIRSLLTAA